MNFIHTLPGTRLQVSALGLGTVKLGRNQGVKYPENFSIPDDASIGSLLSAAWDAGIRLLDTAPAYGNSEERLGHLLQDRQRWVIASKTGEEFTDGRSSFDFSASHTRMSIERSLKRLNTDYLDIVLIHSDGNDLDILQHSDCVETLQACKREGKVRAIGMSSKTIEGGILAASLMDVVMVTWNLQQQDQAVVEYAREHSKGVLVKKALMSGHAGTDKKAGVRESFASVFAEPGISSAIVGTINQGHLLDNVAMVKDILKAYSRP